MALRACLLAALLSFACSSEPLTPAPEPAGEPTGPAATGAPTGTTAPTSTGAPTSTAPTTGAPDPAVFAPRVEYPAGPYGRGPGAIIENVEFIGWRDPAGSEYSVDELGPVRLSDFYDPTGEHTKLIVINASALWCTVCQAEMKEIKRDNLYRAYRERGVEFVGTLFEDVEGGPARPVDLQTWGSAASRRIEFPLVLDPGLRMGTYFTSDATPLNLLIDAQTMRIVYAFMGYDGSANGFWSLVDKELQRRGVTPP